jgi:hypothetical protein
LTLKVRDEDDVLEDNLRYHAAQGVASFVITDNGSTDGTPEILKRWAEAGLAEVIREEGTDFRREGHHWVTRMARHAATRHNADWVLNSDADELWWPIEGTIPEALAKIEDRYGTVVAPRAEFIARPDEGGSPWDRLTIRETRSLLRPKVAHRALEDIWVLHRGQHDVSSGTEPNEVWQRLRTPGRPVLRAVRREGSDVSEDRLVWAPAWPLRIFHFPLRSYAQYRRRVEVALYHGQFAESETRTRLLEAYESGELPELYRELLVSDDELEAGIADGTYTVDERVKAFMRELPDPLAGPVDAASLPRTQLGAGELAAERDQLAFDAMNVLSRTMRMHMIREDRARDRVAALKRRNQRLGKRLKEAQSRGLGRAVRSMTRRRGSGRRRPGSGG